MRGLDTKVLVRYLAQDHAAQAKLVDQLITRAGWMELKEPRRLPGLLRLRRQDQRVTVMVYVPDSFWAV